jgi:DNA-binding transcriptional LysR family regulator
MLAWFRAESIEPRRQHSASHLHTRLHLAEAGVGVALAARSAALRAAGQGLVQVVATVRAAPQLDYVLACADATLPPAARLVADAARRMILEKPDLDAYFAVARQPLLGPPA